MLCPFHLGDVRFQMKPGKSPGEQVYVCPGCSEEVPALYVREYRQFPPVVVSAVGFRGHGKTVYFSSLFYVLEKLDLTPHWPDFSPMPLNQEGMETVRANLDMLDKDTLPPPTTMNFPRPTIYRVSGIPGQKDCTLLLYDTGGECFEKPNALIRYASFVRHARTAMLLISASTDEDCLGKMDQLLRTYVIGMAQLGGDTRQQRLVIVLTKADELVPRLAKAPDIEEYLRGDIIEGFAEPKPYMAHMASISNQLCQFIGTELKAGSFLNLARKSFRAVSFSIVSSLGSRPDGQKLLSRVVPRRVLDPLLFLMDGSRPATGLWGVRSLVGLQ